jgi:hypothetical protein
MLLNGFSTDATFAGATGLGGNCEKKDYFLSLLETVSDSLFKSAAFTSWNDISYIFLGCLVL